MEKTVRAETSTTKAKHPVTKMSAKGARPKTARRAVARKAPSGGLLRETGRKLAAPPLWLTIPVAVIGAYGIYRYAISPLIDAFLADQDLTDQDQAPEGSEMSASAHGDLHSDVAENLPIAKPLQTIPDQEGNYDIDGVSYDSQGVVISSAEHRL